MANRKKTYDVFISHSANDAPLAVELANVCRASGLEAITGRELLPGGEAGDALWEALAESQAVLAVLSPSGPTPSMGIEIGAARAWNKPIFAIVTQPSFTRLPEALSDVSSYPPGRITDVVEAIKRSAQQWSDEDRLLLADIFDGIGVSVGGLALDPKHLQELVRRFNMRAHKNVPAERLLSELLRMRKQGWLNKTRVSERSKRRRRPA
jgi:hypothetical protein